MIGKDKERARSEGQVHLYIGEALLGTARPDSKADALSDAELSLEAAISLEKLPQVATPAERDLRWLIEILRRGETVSFAIGGMVLSVQEHPELRALGGIEEDLEQAS